ncbi:5'-methylthioadenosine phosphorylase [Parafrankia irregularis]|uniref:Purine nucleoside phosphorylase n=1 Tax=Parafrankia irregularis TaxID=795642 RepID=A0A0S4QWS4_9ACTN|nr:MULTISPECIES: S-methyl-5'-thioadenosine phosphorylase [Parafrankia]MBE3200014.1 S-methyl-5'-thioadenosine phosphorylase [Parafrankia sp. CH37]CUU59240.1 5'-methylthioadenosine phosphorylase [Parafrankia irregularis]
MSVTGAEIGVIGGSGFYSLLDGMTDVAVTTPYGDPSDAVAVGEIGGRAVAFLPRHGRGHRLPAHEVNYRANMWALRSLGVRQVIAPVAVGSLRPELGPGAVVVPDQLVDRTSGRAQTYYDSGAAHVQFADPYCPAGRAAVLKAGAEAGQAPVDGATMVVVQGPRFSTRAESRWFAGQGWSLVNMTGHPEAVLARELAVCYTALALVTDYDAGVDAASAVSQAEVFEVFARNIESLRDLVCRVVPTLPVPSARSCPCPAALDGMTLPFDLP